MYIYLTRCYINRLTYEIQGEKGLPLKCDFEDHRQYAAYVCEHVDTTMSTYCV